MLLASLNVMGWSDIYLEGNEWKIDKMCSVQKTVASSVHKVTDKQSLSHLKVYSFEQRLQHYF